MVNNDYDSQLDAAGRHYNVDPALLKAVFHQESSGNPNAPRGSSGEIGAFQIMPSTARLLNVEDPTDMNQAIPAAAKYIRQGLDANNNDPVQAVRYYNGGPQGPNNPKTLQYAAGVANLYPKMAINQGKKATTNAATSTPTSSNDDSLSLGESIINGGSPTNSGTPQTSKDPQDESLSLGESIIEQSMKSAPQSYKAQTSQTSNTSTPDTNNAGPTTPGNAIMSVAKNAGQGFMHGVSSVGDALGSGLNQLAQYGDANSPLLASIDQRYGINPAANAAAHNQLKAQRDAEYQKQYGDSTAADVGNVAGQLVGTLPVGGVIGKVGSVAGQGLANISSGPMTNMLSQAGSRLATGAAQGASASALTGGDPTQGAIGGGALSGLGLAAGIGSAALSSSSPIVSKIGDHLIDAISKGLGAHVGGLPGYFMGQGAAPIISYIVKKAGPKAGIAAAKLLDSNLGSSAGGIVGGQVNSLQNPQ